MEFRRLHSTFQTILHFYTENKKLRISLRVRPMRPFTHSFSLITITDSLPEMYCLYFILDECIAECLNRKWFQVRYWNLALQSARRLKLFVSLRFLPSLLHNIFLFILNGRPAVCLAQPAQL
jgi:hypothetical protein